MHGEHSEQSIIVNAYLSCGRARTHDLQVGSHVPYPTIGNSIAVTFIPFSSLTLSLTTSRGI